MVSPPSLLGKGVGGLGSSLLRPFLTITRADVLAYLTSINQPYRTDSTNADTRFTRNRIRHELLPLLKSFNPDVVRVLAHSRNMRTKRTRSSLRPRRDLLAKAERPRAANTIILDAAALRSAPRAVLRAVLRFLWEREGWPMSDMSFDAWDRAVEVACCNEPACDFPGGITMRHTGQSGSDGVPRNRTMLSTKEPYRCCVPFAAPC